MKRNNSKKGNTQIMDNLLTFIGYIFKFRMHYFDY